MILRRVIEHFRRQEWTAIIIDFVIVVMGVFLGIQVSNWNAAQADARLGQEYVTRLVRDLEEDLAGVRAEVSYYSAVLESVQQTDLLLRAADSDPRALVVNAYRASEITYIAPVRATWDEIVSAGHLDLLPKGAAESGLSQYYAFDSALDMYRMGFDSAYRETVRRIIPIAMQAAIRETCSDRRDPFGNVVSFVETCAFEAGADELVEVGDALRGDPAVAADLRYQYSFAVSATLNLSGIVTTIEHGLAALGADPEGRRR